MSFDLDDNYHLIQIVASEFNNITFTM